jgi:hypothetical protein
MFESHSKSTPVTHRHFFGTASGWAARMSRAASFHRMSLQQLAMKQLKQHLSP